MKIKTVQIHNFRSIRDAKFNMGNYSLLVGENNAGKTNILTALRVLYDDTKFDEKRDFPKFSDVTDKESWIEAEYTLTNEEYYKLKKEYQGQGNTFRIRKYLKSESANYVKINQSNIYAYENGKLSDNLFYGARNISQAKIGDLIYIPDVTKSDDALKLSGPSPFRNLLNYVIKKVISNSNSYRKLVRVFEEFNETFKSEEAERGISINSLIKDINLNIEEGWGIKFGIDITPIQGEDIIKGLINYYIEDSNLDDKVDVNDCGQGVQRYLIYTLITLVSKYQDVKFDSSEFNPDFTLILFEEPEAFLHPTQQENLNLNLKEMSGADNVQLLITTHSTTFVSQNIDDIPSICKIKKLDGETKLYQLTKTELDNLYDENLSILKFLQDKLSDDKLDVSSKEQIKKMVNSENESIEDKLEMESIRYLLWLDKERTAMFFADHILLCEGASEKIFLDHLINTEWHDIRRKNVYILDCMGKFNIGRYMNLLSKLGMSHSVLIDSDKNKKKKEIQELFNSFIEKNKTDLTKGMYAFEDDFESFLGINPPSSERKDLKPLNIMYKYKKQEISDEKLKELRNILLGNNLV